EIDASPGRPVTHCGASEGGAHRRGGKPGRAAIAHGEAGAVHGNALALGEVIVATTDAKFPSRRGRRHSLHNANVVDEAGKHYFAPNAYVVFKSPPNSAR